jgi:hypothetical protein
MRAANTISATASTAVPPRPRSLEIPSNSASAAARTVTMKSKLMVIIH